MNPFRSIVFLTLLLAAPVFAGPRDAQWAKVQEAINKGLPKTAIEELDPIIKGALADKAYGEAVKAIGRRIALEGNIQGNKPEEKITRMQAEIAKAPPEIVPILKTLLGNWYWHYFQHNRWRFMRRTATAEAPGKDFTTWDLPRLFAEIDQTFTQALSAADMLKKIPVTDYQDLLEAGTMPDPYRPALYDVLANEALEFYTSGEQAAAKPEDAFEVSADREMLAAAEKFMAWQPATTDTGSPVLKAIHLYQDLLKFHRKDKDSSAFIDADIARLVYGKNIATGDSKNDRFKAAMESISKKWGDHDLASMALYHWATILQAEGDLVQAHDLARRGDQIHPQSKGAGLCRNLVKSIVSPSASIVTERVWNDPQPKIQVCYRNTTKVFFRAVPWDWTYFLDRKHAYTHYFDEETQKAILGKKPVLEWSHDLAPTKDYKERTAEFPAPKELKTGFYFIVASHDPSFTGNNNQVSITDVWVSDLALVTRPRDGRIEGFVLQAGSGEPIEGAAIQSWHQDNQGGWTPGPNAVTDANGFFSFACGEGRSHRLRVRHQGQELASMNECSSYRPQPPQPCVQTIFFTDRAIYRPGQTIQYKGICLKIDQGEDNYTTLGKQTLTVVFSDPNGKEIARQEREANDYGSFSGSFTAPRDRLMGAMQFRVENGPSGYASFRVEEYKRPKFQVTLDAPKTAGKLNDKVSLQGRAMAYTGAAIDGAQVKYRITREVRMPWWWGWFCWRCPPINTGAQEIAHGSARTEVDGSFKIEFLAKPDLTISEKNEPTFVFHIYADVTDSAGETRSNDRMIRLGYTALEAMMTASDWQTDSDPVTVTIRTLTLDGEPQKAEGSVKVYRLKQPSQVKRANLIQPIPQVFRGIYRGANVTLQTAGADADEGAVDESNPNTWPLGDVVAEEGFTTDKNGVATLQFKLKTGVYRAMLETQDRFGKKVTGMLPIQVLRPKDDHLAIRIPHLFAMPAPSVEPGTEFMALWGTGYEKGRAYIEVEHRNKMIQSYWTKEGETQAAVKVAVTEAMRGGFTVHVTQVRENRAYLSSRHIDVPWASKNLTLSWEHFTSKLQPGQKETWTAVIKGPKAEKAVAEMVATLYDESLDAFVTHNWMGRFNFFRQDYSSAQPMFANMAKPFQCIISGWGISMESVMITYRHFPADLTENLWGYGYLNKSYKVKGAFQESQFLEGAAVCADALAPAAPMASAMRSAPAEAESRADKKREVAKDGGGGDAGVPRQPKGPDLSQVTARKNLNETAFFFPQLVSEKNGTVKLTFTMPEALTQWKFLGFAHDRSCRSGMVTGKTVTQKDLMVQPNPPRFLREGDALEFTVKVSNQSDAKQKGRVKLTLNDARTDKSADQLLGNATPEQAFEIPAKESRSFSWKLTVPDGLTMLTYKAVAASDTVSDGEEGIFPVLCRRIFVTESLPLPIRGPGEKKFSFKKLLESGKSDTLRQEGVTVQMVSNPSWYAVMALPYLMEFPYECSEQTFNRFYANCLARHIANSDPKIHRVFEQWRETPALDSPLEKNQDLKNIVLEETPWVRQAIAESQARRNVGILFDDNRLTNETNQTFEKLAQMQLGDGLWPWFPGGRGDRYITLYITTGFGRMRHLGVDVNVAPAVRALNQLDRWIDEIYREILAHSDPEKNHLDPTIALYLYGRSFFLKDRPVAKGCEEAVQYFLKQARRYWLDLANRQSQAHLALALQRFGDQDTPTAIMKSIRERSVSDEELGLFWRETELSWWWYRAPIETQAMMIEAFAEVAKDDKAVEDCKVWLLKQKQTQDWKTTKATADAVYALLLRGENLLASDALVEMTVGGQAIKPEKVEAGTGFYEKRFSGPEVKPSMGEITVKKVDKGVAWGSIHWQYLEDMTKVTPYEGTPLKLKKTLYTKIATKKGQELQPVKGPLSVGDELVVRIELRTDRDMEYVHMKDQRGSGLEPVNVLSCYRYQDGLRYYESTRDTASHFFIDYLPKGIYVFEYSTRVVHRGTYQTGITEIQCMYAPEFNSHSESFALRVM
jgi:hypothetical protein